MSIRNMMKEGWQPKGRDGGKESWRGDFKGINQVAGWMGKGRDPSKAEAVDHVARPLSALKDPTSFGPPPKHINYHGGAALPNQITPDTRGWGAPLTEEQVQVANQTVDRRAQEEVEEEVVPAGPSLPYRADTTGLRTNHLPPPPVHRDVARSPQITETASQKPRPGLPPRLPTRQNTNTSVTSVLNSASPPPQTGPPAYETLHVRQPSPSPPKTFGINQEAVGRLGNAGVSVPGLGIGSQQSSNPWKNEQSQTPGTISSPPPQAQPATAINQLSELQSRFARMNSNPSSNSNQVPQTMSPPPQTQTPPPTQPGGTTWAEKQSAVRTASNFQKDPSQVSMNDARSAARTANSFRERHKEDISAAGERANQWNRKYNVTGKLNSFLEKHSSPTSEHPPQQVYQKQPQPQPQPPAPQQQQQQQQQVFGAPNPTFTPAATFTPIVMNDLTTEQPHPHPHPQHQQQTQPNPSNVTASIARKPPPPPPPKKPANMHGSNLSGPAAPPPVPLGTKPSYA